LQFVNCVGRAESVGSSSNSKITHNYKEEGLMEKKILELKTHQINDKIFTINTKTKTHKSYKPMNFPIKNPNTNQRREVKKVNRSRGKRRRT